MTQLTDNTVVFIVRLWRERDGAGQPVGECRGMLEHLATRQQVYFLTAEELTRHMASLSDCAAMFQRATQAQASSVAGSAVPVSAKPGWRARLAEQWRRLSGRVLRALSEPPLVTDKDDG